MTSDTKKDPVPCGYCYRCGYGGVVGVGATDCLQPVEKPTTKEARS